MRKLNEEEARTFVEDRCKWKNYKNIDDYIEDIVVCLVYSPWHYSEKRAREQCDERMIFIEQSYEDKMPADDCAAEVGYCCG